MMTKVQDDALFRSGNGNERSLLYLCRIVPIVSILTIILPFVRESLKNDRVEA
jgi:flagellar biosynthesis protein FliQ